VSQESTNRSFDDLARALADGSISRRRALKLFAGTAIAALVPARFAEADDDRDCKRRGQRCGGGRGRCCGQLQCREGRCRRPRTTTTTTTPTTTTSTSTTSTSTSTTSTTPMCIQNGSFGCTDFTQCCSNGLCVGETCCATRDQACTADSECCSGNCDTTSGNCACLPNGTNCDFDLQCCGEVCNGGICCSKEHGSCDTDDDCCTGFCVFNACEPCRPEGDPCTLDDECCSNRDAFCLNGTCST
jgi:hypothetical protein